jgi:hypothetical protein
VALVLVFALQAALALAPLTEAHNGGRDSAHVEQSQPTHGYIHSESTCAVCAVRSLYATAPLQAPVEVVRAPEPAAESHAARPAPNPDDALTNPSRAPPRVA